MKTRTLMEGAGVSLLVLFPYYLPFFHPQNHDLYQHGLPVTSLIGGLLVDILGAFIVATCLLVAVEYLPPAVNRIVEALFAGLVVWGIVEIATMALIRLKLPIESWGLIWERSALVICLLSCASGYFLPRLTQSVTRAVRFVLAAFAFSALWIIPQLLHLAMVQGPAQSAVSNHVPFLSSNGSNQRIIWILFDELSYHQTFDHPEPGIQLPHLDLLRTQSVSFSDIQPTGYSTERIIPSLLLGYSFDDFRSTSDGTLWYRDKSQRRWIAYDANLSLFALAKQNGWTTGVDGWYIPYCTVFAPVLDSCHRDAGLVFPMEAYGASEDKPVLSNAAALPKEYLARLTHRTPNLANSHVQEYRDVMARTGDLIQNNQLRFVFLHLPTPHPPGIYDRQRHSLRAGGNYLDNLVLADDTLGTLLQEIDATPSASRTTVIVSSDHSWRVPMWRPNEDWSAEEEHASGGHFDDRPVLLIHFPGQTSGSDVTSAVPELLEHDMVAGMLTDMINTPQDLAGFVERHSR